MRTRSTTQAPIQTTPTVPQRAIRATTRDQHIHDTLVEVPRGAWLLTAAFALLMGATCALIPATAARFVLDQPWWELSTFLIAFAAFTLGVSTLLLREVAVKAIARRDRVSNLLRRAVPRDARAGGNR